HPEGKALLVSERHGSLSTLLGALSLPAALMEPGNSVQGIIQAERMRQRLTQGQRLVDPLQRLSRIAQQPQGQGPIEQTHEPEMQAIHKGMGPVVAGIVEHSALLQVCAGWDQLPKSE